MFWKDEPQGAHPRVRNRHSTRQESLMTRIICLGIEFFFSILTKAILLCLRVTYIVLAYMAMLVILPVYLGIALFTVWSLHFLRSFTGIGPEWLKERPSGFTKKHAHFFKEVIRSAFTRRSTTTNKPDKLEEYYQDPKGPYMAYQYKSLPIQNDEQMIRLVDLLPGQRDSPIRCRFRHVSLKNDEPAYEAVSYCWGGEKPSTPIYVDENGEESRQILATNNLVQALLRFRQPDRTRSVWADGICINQGREAEAIDECNRQVKLMGQIYQKASHCLIWLGRGPPKAAQYIEAIKELIRIGNDFASTSIKKDPIFFSPEEKARHKIPHGRTPHFKGLQLVLSNPWLTRVWIVQEASLAQQATIYLGDGSVAWNEVVAAQSFARNIGLLYTELESPINGLKAIGCNRVFQDSRLPVKGENSILALFARSRDFDATNAKDKVYGLISLLSDQLHSQWPVGLGAEQVYLYAAYRILKNENNLDLLGVPKILDPSVHLEREKLQSEIINIPSWVPDWRSNFNQVPLTLQMLEFAPHGDRKFTSTRDSTHQFNFRQDGRLLGVDGYPISTIQTLGALHRYRTIQLDVSPRELIQKRIRNVIELVDTYLNWKQSVRLSSQQERYPHSAEPMTMREAFWRTITAYDPSSHTVSTARLAESFEAFDAMATSVHKRRLLIKIIPLTFAAETHWLGANLLILFEPIIRSIYSVMAQDPEAQDFCNHIVFSYGRRMARTEDGHFALVPGNAAVGDEITLLRGARAPIVLRKHLADDNWEHVGEAYVEGLMNGERWDESLCERRWLA